MWGWAYALVFTTGLCMASSTITMETHVSTKSVTHKADHHFGIKCPKCFCAILFYRVNFYHPAKPHPGL